MVQIYYGLVVIENGYYKFNVFLVAYAMRAGGLTLLPRGGVSAWLKPQNNLPQLVLIGNLPDNFSGDLCVGTGQAPNKLLQATAAAKAALRHSGFPAKFWSPDFLIKAGLPIFGAEPPQGPALALAPSPSPFPTFPRSSQGCSLTPHPHTQVGPDLHVRVSLDKVWGQGLAIWG